MVAVGGELSGRVDFRVNVSPDRAFFGPQAAHILEYSLSDRTFGMVSEFSSYSSGTNGNGHTYSSALDDITFGVRGVLGAFQYASYMHFGVVGLYGDTVSENGLLPGFREWLNLAWTSIAGVDVWAMGGIDSSLVTTNGVLRIKPMSDEETIVTRIGSTFGVHGIAGDLEVWSEMNFGGGHLIKDMAFSGYDLDHISSTWYYCEWGDIDGVCDSSFKDLWAIATYPFGCASIFSSLWINCEGFDSLTLGTRDVQVGADWFYIDHAYISFETDAKRWYLDLNLSIPDVYCIQPHFGWDLDVNEPDSVIDSIELAGLTMEYNWDGIKFLFAERFRSESSDSSPYVSITTDARLWSKVASAESFVSSSPCWSPCRLEAIDEAFGIEVVGSDACCGGQLYGGLYVFFDHELEASTLFDWSQTRASVNFGITQSLDVGIAAYFDWYSSPLYTFRFTYTGGALRIFDHDFFNPTRCTTLTTAF